MIDDADTTKTTDGPEPRSASGIPEPGRDDSPAVGPLIMLAGEDEMLCIDDACVPAGAGR